MCIFQQLSEEFIAKNHDKVNWVAVAEYQMLSEAFIDTWSDRLGWSHVSSFQQLSEAFILTHLDRLNIEIICQRYPEICQKYNIQLYAAIARN